MWNVSSEISIDLYPQQTWLETKIKIIWIANEAIDNCLIISEHSLFWYFTACLFKSLEHS